MVGVKVGHVKVTTVASACLYNIAFAVSYYVLWSEQVLLILTRVEQRGSNGPYIAEYRIITNQEVKESPVTRQGKARHNHNLHMN